MQTNGLRPSWVPAVAALREGGGGQEASDDEYDFHKDMIRAAARLNSIKHAFGAHSLGQAEKRALKIAESELQSAHYHMALAAPLKVVAASSGRAPPPHANFELPEILRGMSKYHA